jgi:hypothetical protein
MIMTAPFCNELRLAGAGFRLLKVDCLFAKMSQIPPMGISLRRRVSLFQPGLPVKLIWLSYVDSFDYHVFTCREDLAMRVELILSLRQQ